MILLSKLYRLWKSYFWTETEHQLFNIFSQESNLSKNKDDDFILLQCVENYYYYSLFGQIVTDIRRKNNIQVEQYVLRNFNVATHSSLKSFIKSKLFNNRLMDKKWTNLYSAYCNKIAYSNEQSIGILNDIKLFLKAKKITKLLISKEELIALRSEEILIGDLIYDTYLRFKPAPTVDFKDFYLVIVIWKALRNEQITKNYFAKKQPKALLQSYSSYIQHGITARIALLNNIDVYTFGNYQSVTKKLSLDDFSHVASIAQYRTHFEEFKDKEEKLLEAELALQSRLSGHIDSATAYMKKSAYMESEYDLPEVKNAVIVFLHDFYDSPHIYKSMVFADFLDWIEFTLDEFDKQSVTYYLKPHPNQLPESNNIVTELCNKHPRVKLVSTKITNKQLVDAGIKLGITVYGTIAHELAYMGVPVITCGDNPHSSYNFCFEAKNKEHYAELIRNMDDLHFNDPEAIKIEVSSFYYMHNLNISATEKKLLESASELRIYFENLRAGKSEMNETALLKKLEKFSEVNTFSSKLVS